MKDSALKSSQTIDEAVTSVVEVVHGREGFLALRGAWNEALLSGPDPTPALEHDFLRLWHESFGQGQSPTSIVVRDENGIRAAISMLIGAGFVERVPVRVARALTNSHSTRGGVLFGPDGTEALPALVHRLVEEPWDVLELRDLPRTSGQVERFAEELRKHGFRTSLDRPMESPYIVLPGSFDELNGRLSSHFRQNLRRRRRRLQALGTVGFETIQGFDGLDQALEDAFEIEASGWKGREGSAIRLAHRTSGFYAAWARDLARDGRLRLSFLTLDGKRVAFQFGHLTRGRYHLPKCSFDERLKECSPGQLLMVDVLRRCIEEGVETFEFLGHMMTWKRDWTPLVRPHATLWAYRTNLQGTAAWTARAHARPLAGRVLRGLRSLRLRGGK